MKENLKILFSIGFVFLFSFLALGIFLDTYSQGLLTSEKNVMTVGTIIDQNPKQVTLDVIQNILGETQTDNVNVNSFGFRGGEFSQVKPDNTLRVFLLGGSQVFGTGATSDKTTIPAYIQKYLDEDDNEFTIEIINSGLKGIDSRKELLFLQNMLLGFTPDLIIVYDGLNDLRSGNSSTKIFENWDSMCKIGQENNFDVIIALQPIAGFGNKLLTKDESSYLQNARDYNDNSLIESINQYEKYAENLKNLENCSKGIDLRTVFDNELDSIYIDEAHVSDEGNSIVAKSLLEYILPYISKDTIHNNLTNNKIERTNSEMFSEFTYTMDVIITNFQTKMIPTLSSPSESNIFSQKNKSFEDVFVSTQSQFYENDEISVKINIFSVEDGFSDNRIIKLTTINEKDNSIINNVTYLMTISKDGEKLFTSYFFAEDELFIEIIQKDGEDVKITGERRYEMDALVMNQDSPISISGTFFEEGSSYEFDINLRTIHDTENLIFLNGFYAEISP